jgi:amino acid transporter
MAQSGGTGRPVEPAQSELPRVMGLRDVVLFNITAIVGLRWLTTASNQFGWASLLLWLVAMLIFFLPLATAVRELADIDPRAGGIYRWVHGAFGGRPAFVAGWSYWVSNLVYFPALLVSTAAMLAYAGGPSTVPLGDNSWFIGVVSVIGLAIAVWLNVVGLRIGKWLQNAGAYGTWIPLFVFVALAVWSLLSHGSATPLAARDLVPKSYDFQSINLFGTLLFAFGGLELAPTLGSEIHDAAATLRRGVALSGLAIVAMYIVGTAAMLVALPPATISLTNGVPQATAALVTRLGVSALGIVPAVLALLMAFGNIGGVGAWLAGVARLPYAAGVDRVLPPGFSRVHPRWRTPYVSLLVQGALAAVFIVASLAGTTVKAAYLALAQTTVVLFFIPYLFMFAAYLRLRRQRSPLTTLVGWSGLASVAFAIVLAFVPPKGENPVLFELKVAGGVLLFTVVGWLLSASRKLSAQAPSS